MTPEETGIVHLEDLPSTEVYIELKKQTHNLLKQKIRDYGPVDLARKLEISDRIILHWLSDRTAIRLDVLSKICKFFHVEYKKNIRYIRGKSGKGINNPKLPFDFRSCEGVRVIAGILGDGGIPTRASNAYYANTNKDLINGFIKDIKEIVGNVKISSRDIIKETSTTEVLEFPKIISNILFMLSIRPGKKVELNQHIPKFIFDLNEEAKLAFIAQFIDDEGSVNKQGRHISITASCLESYGKPNILSDIQKILAGHDILCSIYPNKVYYSQSGPARRLWRVQINGQIQLRKLNQGIKIRSKTKRDNLKMIINSFKLEIFRKRDIVDTYLKIMSKVEETQGYFTSLDLAKATRRVIGSCRNTIIKFKKKGLIRCVKEPTSGEYHEYGEYIVVKNADHCRSPSP